MTADRIPPQALEAEMAAIGAALVSREALEAMSEIVVAGDFYAHSHEAIYQAIAALGAAGKPVDKLTVAQALRDRQKLELVGGLPYLSSLAAEAVGDAASAEYYARIVREKAQLRRLIAAGNAIAAIGFDGEADVDDAIARAESAFSVAVDHGVARSGGVTIYEAMIRNYMRLLERSGSDEDSGAILTPFRGLNAAIGPLMPGELVIWPAAAKSGKSALIFQLADYIAAHYGAVFLASLEMHQPEVAMRYTALYGRLSVRRQRQANLREVELSEAEFANVAYAVETMRERPLFVHDLNSIKRLSELRRELRLLSRTQTLRALIVDGINFLADVDPAKNDRSTKNDRMDLVYKGLIRIAKEFQLVVHAVQHVNREGMSGPPTLRDIRDGGNPEGHAHAIIVPYRPKPNGTADERREGKLIVLAAREGEAGPIDGMEFIGARSMWIEQSAKRPWFEPAPSEPEMAMEFV